MASIGTFRCVPCARKVVTSKAVSFPDKSVSTARLCVSDGAAHNGRDSPEATYPCVSCPPAAPLAARTAVGGAPRGQPEEECCQQPWWPALQTAAPAASRQRPRHVPGDASCASKLDENAFGMYTQWPPRETASMDDLRAMQSDAYYAIVKTMAVRDWTMSGMVRTTPCSHVPPATRATSATQRSVACARVCVFSHTLGGHRGCLSRLRSAKR
jgi:hypothetical protein